MKFRFGHVIDGALSGYADVIIATCNSFMKSDGSLTMGKGAAKELADYYPWAPGALGAAIRRKCLHLGIYGLVILGGDLHPEIGAFQSKLHWKDDSPLETVAYSIGKLEAYARSNSHKTIYMNYPAVGYGSMLPADIQRYAGKLPDNVVLHLLDKEQQEWARGTGLDIIEEVPEDEQD